MADLQFPLMVTEAWLTRCITTLISLFLFYWKGKFTKIAIEKSCFTEFFRKITCALRLFIMRHMTCECI